MSNRPPVPEGWEFRLSPDRRLFAFYDPGNGPWFVPEPAMRGRFVDSGEMDRLDWYRYTPVEERPVLTDAERSMLRYAVNLVDDRIASEPDEFDQTDRDAAASLRHLATGPVVAYRNPSRPGVLLCREHGEGWAGLTGLTSDDLPKGGICTYGDPANPADVCGRDVLIPQGGQSS